MTATLSMVPVAQICPSRANPRAEFDDERMAELIESVKRHGIITPLPSRGTARGYAIIAGERRYRAAKAAELREVPAKVREVEGEALTLASTPPSTTGRPANGRSDASANASLSAMTTRTRPARRLSPRTRRGRTAAIIATSPTPGGSRIVSGRRSAPTSRQRRSARSGRGPLRAPRRRAAATRRRWRREQRQRDYKARVAARSRNLDLGAALARWEPKLGTDAVQLLLGSLVLLHYGKPAAWAHRVYFEQPTTTNKQGRVAVRYPRGAQGEKEHQEGAMAALMRARSPEAALAALLRLLVAQRLADAAGLPGADRQGFYERRELTGCAVLTKLAKRFAPPSVKQHLATQEAEREQREQAWRDEQTARLQEQHVKLAAGEPIRCECCHRMIESADEAAEKDGTLVHVGDCEQQWGSADDSSDDPEEALDEAA